jgi:hypothetical protein
MSASHSSSHLQVSALQSIAVAAATPPAAAAAAAAARLHVYDGLAASNAAAVGFAQQRPSFLHHAVCMTLLLLSGHLPGAFNLLQQTALLLLLLRQLQLLPMLLVLVLLLSLSYLCIPLHEACLHDANSIL